MSKYWTSVTVELKKAMVLNFARCLTTIVYWILIVFSNVIITGFQEGVLVGDEK